MVNHSVTTATRLERIKAWTNINPFTFRRGFRVDLSDYGTWVAKITNRDLELTVSDADFDLMVEKVVGQMAIEGWMRNT